MIILTVVECNPNFSCSQPYNESDISETTPQCGGCPHTKCAGCTESKDERWQIWWTPPFSYIPADDIWACVSSFFSLHLKEAYAQTVQCGCSGSNLIGNEDCCAGCGHTRCASCTTGRPGLLLVSDVQSRIVASKN